MAKHLTMRAGGLREVAKPPVDLILRSAASKDEVVSQGLHSLAPVVRGFARAKHLTMRAAGLREIARPQ
jgi:hypothetical protein